MEWQGVEWINIAQDRDVRTLRVGAGYFLKADELLVSQDLCCMSWPAGRSVVGWLVGWVVCWSDGLLVGWFVGRMVCWLLDWLVGWMICWMDGLLVGWFVGRMVCW